MGKTAKTSLLDRTHASTVTPRAARGKRSSTTIKPEKAAKKAVKDNAKDLMPHEIFGTHVDGKTFAEQVEADKAANCKAPGTFSFGSQYWANMRDRFRSGENPLNRMKADPSQKVRPELWKKMVAISAVKPQYKPYYYQLGMWPTACHEGELIAILRCSLHMSPCTSLIQRQVIQETMKWVLRHKLHEKYPDKISLCKQHFQATLLEVPVTCYFPLCRG